MDFKQASEGSISTLESIYVKKRAKKLLELAVKHFDLANGTITIPGGLPVPASRFCVDVNYHMERFVPLDDVPADKAEQRKTMWAGIEDPQESYQVAVLLLTLARMRYSTIWSFGSELRSTLDILGFKITRPEWIAVMAQAKTYLESPFGMNSEKLFWKNPIAIALYAAEFASVCGTLHNSLISEKEIPADVMQMFKGAERQNPKELLEAMIQTFVPVYLGSKNEAQLAGFMEYLKTSGFFASPATANAHNNFDTGLLIHTIDVLYKLADVLRPQTPAEMGMVVLLAVCHDLSEVGVFKKSYRNEAVEGPAYTVQNGKNVLDQKRTMQWPDQRPYHMEMKVVWKREDPIPIGAGPKSLHIAVGFFRCGALTEDMKAAISNHHRDFQNNPCCDALMIRNSICRSLHIADFLASMLGEKAV